MAGLNAHFFIFTIVISYRTDTAIKIYSVCVCGVVWCVSVWMCVATSTRLLLRFDFTRRRRRRRRRIYLHCRNQ